MTTFSFVSRLSLVVLALALMAFPVLAASDLERQVRFERLDQDDRDRPAAPEATSNPITADELKGMKFVGAEGSTFEILADGSWRGQAAVFERPFHAAKLSGPSFVLGKAYDRQVVTFKLPAPASQGVSAFVQRLSAEDAARVPAELGTGHRVVLAVIYGSLADGQVHAFLGK